MQTSCPRTHSKSVDLLIKKPRLIDTSLKPSSCLSSLRVITSELGRADLHSFLYVSLCLINAP